MIKNLITKHSMDSKEWESKRNVKKDSYGLDTSFD